MSFRKILMAFACYWQEWTGRQPTGAQVMAIKSQKSVLADVFGLRENPFKSSHIYNVDKPDVFVPEMYGEQLDEFHRKFFLLPMGKESNKQVLGAVWSSHKG